MKGTQMALLLLFEWVDFVPNPRLLRKTQDSVRATVLIRKTPRLKVQT